MVKRASQQEPGEIGAREGLETRSLPSGRGFTYTTVPRIHLGAVSL